jgi:hypothetical protein
MLLLLGHCPGPNPSKRAVTRPSCPYISAIQNRFTVGNAKLNLRALNRPGQARTGRWVVPHMETRHARVLPRLPLQADEQHLGFDRIVASETETPIMLVNLV